MRDALQNFEIMSMRRIREKRCLSSPLLRFLALLLAPLLSRGFRQTALISASIVFSLCGLARADLFGLWLRGKGDLIGGNGTRLEQLDGRFGGGVEFGIEILELSLWADWLSAGSGYHSGSVNAGFDFSLGDPVKVRFGLYGAGLLILSLREEATRGELNFSEEDQSNLSAAGISAAQLDQLQGAYEQALSESPSVPPSAFGLAARARLSLEWAFLPACAVGLQGTLGYHYLLSSEEASGEVQARAIEDAGQREGFSPELVELLVKSAELERVDASKAYGLHHSFGAFFQLYF